MGLETSTIIAIVAAVTSVGGTVYAMSLDVDQGGNSGGTTVTKYGTQNPRNRVYGTAIVGSTRVYSNVLNRDRSYRTDVFSVGGIGSLRFHNVWIEDVKMFEVDKDELTDPLNPNSGIYDDATMRSRYKASSDFKIQWRSGQENQVAAQLAIDNSDGEWTVNHKGALVPQIVVYADYSTDQDYVFFGDFYTLKALVTGGEVYDPRIDNVYDVARYSGSSSNPALAVLDYLRSTYYGLGIKDDYLNIESFRYAASFCEAKGLEINSAINSDESFADVLQDMLSTCGGALAIVDGRIKFLVEEQVLLPLYELNEDDIIKDTLKVSPSSTSDYYNVVSTTFKSAINNDNDDNFVIPSDTTTDPRVLEDGEVITKSINMPYSRDAYEADAGIVNNGVKYMTNLIYNKSFYQNTVTFDIDLHEYPLLEPWSVIALSNEVYGFESKMLRVHSMVVSTDSDRFNIATITLGEYADEAYEGSLEGVTATPRPPAIDVVLPPSNLKFTLQTYVNTGYGLLSWDANTFTSNTSYDIDYRLSSASDWTRHTSVYRGRSINIYNLQGADYDFRVRTYDVVLGGSEWVEVRNITIAPTYSLPTVTGLAVTSSGGSFTFSWNDMSDVAIDNIVLGAANSGNSTGRVSDVFKHYKITLTANGKTVLTKTQSETVYTLSLEKNKELFGGVPARDLSLSVVMVDTYGVISNLVGVNAKNLQSATPTGVKATNTNGNSTIEWTPSSDNDFEGTEVHVSTTKNFTPTATTLHTLLGKESFYVFNFPTGDKTTRYMRIGHFDSFGRDGVLYSPEITLTYEGAASVKLIRLITDSQAFVVSNSGVVSPSQINLSTSTQNTEGTIKWTTSPSITLRSGTTSNDRIIKYTDLGSNDQVKVTVEVDGVSDTVTLYTVRDGSNGTIGKDGVNGDTVYEQYRYGQVIVPDTSWTSWGADMRSTDIYRQTRIVTNGVAGSAGNTHRISGVDGKDGERLFTVYHKNAVGTANKPSTPTGSGTTGGWSTSSEGAHWMSQKVALTVSDSLTFWSSPIALTGEDGKDITNYDDARIANSANTAASVGADPAGSAEAAKVYALAKANLAETTAKAYADGIVTEAEAAAIAEAQKKADAAQANAISAASSDATAKANAVIDYVDVFKNTGEFIRNFDFGLWTGTYPTYFGNWGGTNTYYKDTTLAVNSNSLVFKPSAADNAGANFTMPNVPNQEYVTLTLKLMLISGNFSGAGVLLDWSPQTNYRNSVRLDTRLQENYGIWQTVSIVVKRPDNNLTGNFAFNAYLMANYSGLGSKTAKEIAFNSISVKTSTEAEIAAYNAEGYADSVGSSTLSAASSDATAKANAAQLAAQSYALAKANLAETTAKAYADGVVTEAEANAIAEAQKKADAAQAAAISAAKTDATTKANSALSSAKTDATTKANNALSSAKTYSDLVVKTLNADNIVTGTLDAQRISSDVYDGSLVNASLINAGQIKAANIDTTTFKGNNGIFDGEISGGSITGSIVRTSQGGARAEMKDEGYKFAAYDANGVPTFYVRSDGHVVMRSGTIETSVLDNNTTESNIVTWVGNANRGGEFYLPVVTAVTKTDNYFKFVDEYITTGKAGSLDIRFFDSTGLLIQDDYSSSAGGAAPAQRTVNVTETPHIYLCDPSGVVIRDLGNMDITYTTTAIAGAAGACGTEGTYGRRVTYAHFSLNTTAADFNVAEGVDLANYSVRVWLGNGSFGNEIKAANGRLDTIVYKETSSGGRLLPHSSTVVWVGNSRTIPNVWGAGLYMLVGIDKGNWRRHTLVFIDDTNPNEGTDDYEDENRALFPVYGTYIDYSYTDNTFSQNNENITKIIKITGA